MMETRRKSIESTIQSDIPKEKRSNDLFTIMPSPCRAHVLLGTIDHSTTIVIILLCPREVSQNQRCRVSRENTDRSRFLNFSAHVSWIWSCLRAHVSVHESGNRCRPIESLNGRPTGKETGELKRRVVAAATQTEDLALARGLSSASVAFWTRSRSQELNHRFIPRGDCNVN